MTRKCVFRGIGPAAVALGLIVPCIPIHADPPASVGKQRVQVKFEWVTDNSPVSKTLTLATTEDTSGTVSLEPDKPGGERTSATIQPHINRDGTIGVRFNVDHSEGGADQRIISMRVLKPSQRVLIGGLVRTSQTEAGTAILEQTPPIIAGLLADAASETHTLQVYMTVTLLPADDGKLPLGDMPSPPDTRR